jgi:macrolide-specific efflux system membrane fusion protein
MSMATVNIRTWSALRAAAVAALAAGALLCCGLFPKEKTAPEPVLPEPPTTSNSITYPVTRGNIQDGIEGTAQITPVREVALYFKEAGRIREIDAAPNQKVAAGDVLARLDIGDLEHQLRLAQIDLKIAQLTLDRMEVMGAGSFDRRIQELVIARQQETVDYLRQRGDASTIRAPFAGIIKSVDAQISDRIAEYVTIIELSDPEAFELQMRVNRDQYSMMMLGLAAEVNDTQDMWLPTRVIQTTHLDPARDASVRVEEFIVHLSLPRGVADLRMGRSFGARIVLRRRTNALLIPLACLREFGGRTYVRVMEGDARFEKDVRVGIRTSTEAEIIEGLKEGQLVIGR